MTPAVTQLFVAWAGAALLMLVMWLVQRRTQTAGIVDVAWALGIGATVAGLACVTPGEPVRRGLVALLAGVWALRLAAHLAVRLRRETEDGRYADLRAWAGPRAALVFFIFFQMQATWVVLFSLPQFIALHNRAPLGVYDALAVLVWLIALAGESVADRQLAAFKHDPTRRGQVCNVGLWRYSRHPNYFFEWLHWFIYPLLAVGCGWAAWLTLLGPVLMLCFLLKVTGIPPTEARALKSRGDAYRAYQRTTSAFFPWPPKRPQPSSQRSESRA